VTESIAQKFPESNLIVGGPTITTSPSDVEGPALSAKAVIRAKFAARLDILRKQPAHTKSRHRHDYFELKIPVTERIPTRPKERQPSR